MTKDEAYIADLEQQVEECGSILLPRLRHVTTRRQLFLAIHNALLEWKEVSSNKRLFFNLLGEIDNRLPRFYYHTLKNRQKGYEWSDNNRVLILSR